MGRTIGVGGHTLLTLGEESKKQVENCIFI